MILQSVKREDEPLNSRCIRLAIVVSHPIQHFCPMYRSIAADGRVELQVIFAESGAVPRFDKGFGRIVKWQDDILQGVPHTLVSSTEAARSQAVLCKLREFRPDVVYVHGYALRYLRNAMRWAQRKGIPVLMTTDSELRHPRPWYVRLVKRLLLPHILQQVDLFLTVGDENEKYFEHYGVTRDRFHRVPFSIDSPHYDAVLSVQTTVRQSVRRRLRIPHEAAVVLTVGKLIPRKGQSDLLRAFARALASTERPAVLLIAGDGPERTRLEKLANPLECAVRFLGFVGVQELPEYYAASDVYVHPSTFDPHPLAISEALYCGLPVVVSDRVGSIGPTDDVQVGRNGWVYANGDIEALSNALAHLIEHPSIRTHAGTLSTTLGQMHSSSSCGGRFVDGAMHALSQSNRTVHASGQPGRA